MGVLTFVQDILKLIFPCISFTLTACSFTLDSIYNFIKWLALWNKNIFHIFHTCLSSFFISFFWQLLHLLHYSAIECIPLLHSTFQKFLHYLLQNIWTRKAEMFLSLNNCLTAARYETETNASSSDKIHFVMSSNLQETSLNSTSTLISILKYN